MALTHGFECYFAHRGLGPCSEEVDLGHIIPDAEGGDLSVENCQIECSFHNQDRSTRSIEQYLASKQPVLVPEAPIFDE